jgi:hypothetical protein
MLRLLRVEISRLLARRVVRLLTLALVVGMLVLNGVQFARASKHFDPAGRQPSSTFVVGPDGTSTEVQQFGFPRDPRFKMAEKAHEQTKAVGIVVSLLAFMVGTSFIGAEWAAGTLQALLFWEPRRERVLLAKMAGLSVAVAVASFFFQMVELGISFLTATFRGTFTGTSAHFYREIFLTSGRLAGLAVFTALLAFAIAGLTRHTAAALGVAFAYFAILENVLRSWRPGWARYLVSNQFAALVEKRLLLEGPVRATADGFVEGKVFVLTMGRATLTLVCYLAIALGAMTLLFTRRDVT